MRYSYWIHFISRFKSILRSTLLINQHVFQTSKRKKIIAITASLIITLAIGTQTISFKKTEKVLTIDLPLSSSDYAEQLNELQEEQDESNTFTIAETVLANDNLSKILARISAKDPQILAYIDNNINSRALKQLRPGQVVLAQMYPNGKLLSLFIDAPLARTKTIYRTRVERSNDNQFTTTLSAVKELINLKSQTGVIQDGFFTSVAKQGLPTQIVRQLPHIFEGSFDLQKDFKDGDRFHVVYQKIMRESHFVGYGRVLAFSIQQKNRLREAIWFDTFDNAAGYYDSTGRRLGLTFLRSPVAMARISSQFGMRRHPITGKQAFHSGIDYAAATGTKIVAVANGIINFAGSRNGYGRMVTIQHSNGFETRYAHVRGFAPGIKAGQRISQGDTIAYVGQTGAATGPHLHFELRHRGIALSPQFPPASFGPKLEDKALQAFQQDNRFFIMQARQAFKSLDLASQPVEKPARQAL